MGMNVRIGVVDLEPVPHVTSPYPPLGRTIAALHYITE